MYKVSLSGPIYHDRTPNLSVQISALDMYYNHHVYGAWQHAGYTMGNPQILSPLYNGSGSLAPRHNRVRAHHDYYLSYFNHTSDSLIVYRPVKYTNDSIVSLSDLSRYGVPGDGRFHVDALTGDRMQLSSPETSTLKFRKY